LVVADWEVPETQPEPNVEARDEARRLLVITEDVSTILLPACGRLTIGRSPETDVRIDDGLASRVHAALHVADRVEIEDLGSANGTRLGQMKLAPRTRLVIKPGMAVEIGRTVIVLPVGRTRLDPSKQSDSNPIVRAATMIELYRVIERIAAAPISVLILGETGVGKELLAEAIHGGSPRASGPLVRINCAALSEHLIEAELFGYEKGAFTGADRTKMGLMEAANGGTVFFDEIGELPPQTQAKLLRAIEQREVLHLGSLQPHPINVRIVSATNRDLEEETRLGRFRSDLFFRLNGVTLKVPPLRERKGEIEPLARMFAERMAREVGRTPPAISASTLDLLRAHAWPGNVRELKNVIDRAVLLARGDALEPVDLPFDASTANAELTAIDESEEDRQMRERITRALDQCAGNQTRAAEVLGFSRQTLSRWLDRLQLRRPRKGRFDNL
jgi:transcriptional regulator with PAS, ATPase and Fis domain